MRMCAGRVRADVGVRVQMSSGIGHGAVPVVLMRAGDHRRAVRGIRARQRRRQRTPEGKQNGEKQQQPDAEGSHPRSVARGVSPGAGDHSPTSSLYGGRLKTVLASLS